MVSNKVFAGWIAACVLSAAQAGTLAPPAGTADAAPRAAGSLAAERFDYDEPGLPQVTADMNEQIIRNPSRAMPA